MQKISRGGGWALFDVSQTRQIEVLAASQLPSNALMQRAGLAVARLALAVAPHARQVWVACGPGNNGGDGLEAALHLHRWGKAPWVTWLGQSERCPPDAAMALERLQQAGIRCQSGAPEQPDLCIDALLGIGAQPREPQGVLADHIRKVNASTATVVAVDVPSGLNADTGQGSALRVQAHHTLSLLTLKPGLFTAGGRDATGMVWLDTLGVPPEQLSVGAPVARLPAKPALLPRRHASHKGDFGDVAVVGGARGMTGAVLLAATAALHAGCGRVFAGLLDEAALAVDASQPEIMFRAIDALALEQMVSVFGCGGGTLPSSLISRILRSPAPIVIDADAINSIASDAAMQSLLVVRGQQHQCTVLTPHPLEAARLLGWTTQQVQSDRLTAASHLSQRYACTVVLKGSGSVICAPHETTVVNNTGNARLATAGSGDVLAGMVGAALAQGKSAFNATCTAVYRHGELADQWPTHEPLTAGALAHALSLW
ncbi:MAG: NAD(P)H-hydrate dehydratase [Rhodoferax sp.]|nr:NAD(P)H-hydrate dehydratase [Rhodoferax sp.]